MAVISSSVSGPAQAAALLSASNDLAADILRKLSSIDCKFDSLERRVTETESNLAGQTTHPNTNQSTGNDVAHDWVLSWATNVVPSTDYAE